MDFPSQSQVKMISPDEFRNKWNEDTIGGALSIVVHTAYHLGEILQTLDTLKK